MPVSHKGRLVLEVSAAAMVIVAASTVARAQNATQGFDLRGTETPFSQTGAQAQNGDYGNSDAVSPYDQPDANGNSSSGGGDAGLVANPAAKSRAGATAPNAADTNSGQASQSDTAGRSNYGRPKPKKPKLYQLPVLQKPQKPGFPQLPALTTYKSYKGEEAARKLRAREGSKKPETEAEDPPPTAAVLPYPQRRPKPKPEEKPYDPLGVDVGSLRLFPYVEADTGYDSNPNLLADGVKGSLFLHGETGLKAQSQWSQHSLAADIHAGYYDYFRVPDANRPDVNGTITGRVDLSKDTKLNLETRFGLSTQQPGSSQIAIPGSVFITNRPLVATFGQTVGASRSFNRLTLDLRGTFDRIVFGDATQSDGSELLLSQDNYNTYGLVGRASYEVTPGVIPFVELRGDTRRYDSYFDQDGFARNSNGVAGKLGTKFELTHLLTGEISAGYADRAYADPRLGNLKAPTIDASLVYNATPLTTLTLTAATDLSETTVADSAGAISRRVSAQVTHALLRNLNLTGTLSYQVNQYQGVPLTEYLYSAGVGAEYSLTRSVVIRGSFTHQRLRSDVAGDDYTQNVFLVGLKLQR